MVTSDLRAEVEIWPFRACAMHPATNIRADRSLWTWLWGRYHVLQNVFLVYHEFVHKVLRIRGSTTMRYINSHYITRCIY